MKTKIEQIELCIGDIKASGLGDRSYPIEVAQSTMDGVVRSWFVKPEHFWIYWDLAAEEMHPISRETLRE